MAKSVLNAPQFQTEAAAFAYVEARLWPDGAFCPHCGECERVGRLGGKTTRIGLHKCYSCKGQFTVRQGTIFESSHLPLHLWLQVIHLMCASKKGISTRQIQRMLDCSMKTAWFLTHRIREAMSDGGLTVLGGGGGDVEADETFIGRDGNFSARGGKNMNAVLSMVDRQTGQLRSVVLDNVTANNVTNVLGANVAQDTRLLTDSSNVYRRMGSALAGHEAVNHSVGEYVRVADPTVHTNTVEGTFSIFKRGCAASISTARASTFIAIWRNLTSGIPTASRSALMTRPAPKTRSRACVVSASPTKQLVAGGPPPKAGSSGNQRWFTKPHRWPRRHTAQLELPFGE